MAENLPTIDFTIDFTENLNQTRVAVLVNLPHFEINPVKTSCGPKYDSRPRIPRRRSYELLSQIP